VSVPGKLYEYLAAGRPILAMTAEGETADIVRASGNGVVVPADDEAGIEAGLLQVIAMAGRPLAPVDAALYDGRIGAVRTEALLRQFAEPRRRDQLARHSFAGQETGKEPLQ